MDEKAEENAPRTESPVCPHCIEPVDPLNHFCPHCGGPITAHAATDPLGQVYTMGHGYRNASDRPSLIVLIGMWLIFGPSVLILLLINVPAWFGWLGDSAAIGGPTVFGISGSNFSWLPALVFHGLLVLNIAILWKVTARYIRPKPTTDTPDEAPA